MRELRRLVVSCAIGVACLIGIGHAETTPSSDEQTGPHSSCTSCHGTDAAAAIEGSGAAICRECHSDLGRADGRRGRLPRSAHVLPDGPLPAALAPGGGGWIENVDCLSCHSAHPNGNRFQLHAPGDVDTDPGATLDPSSRSCLGCHPDFGRTVDGGSHIRHPVGVTLGALTLDPSEGPFLPLADVRGTADPADDVIACVTCHVVHSSDHRFLLRWPENRGKQACLECHLSGPGFNGRGFSARFARRR